MSHFHKFIEGSSMRRITENWLIDMDTTYETWVEDGSLAFAKPGRTIWIDCWGDGDEPSKSEIVALIKSEASPDRDDLFEADEGEVYRYAYRLVEFEDGGRRFAVYAFAVVEGNYLQVAIYFDDPQDKPWGESLARSIQYSPTESLEFSEEE
ncbi:MAG: hypothetical protein DWH81_03025 [Planctomycetota bacterium]|jgi:hypothetical protein|nr:MAG: hypothetical protein DWH81_03025 [Planctomycetota bacterium]